MGRAPINITYSLPFLVRFHHHDQQHHRHTNDNVIWRGFSFRISRRSCHCVPPTDLTRIFGRGLELSCITTICLSVYMSTCCPHAMPATSEPGSATPKSPPASDAAYITGCSGLATHSRLCKRETEEEWEEQWVPVGERRWRCLFAERLKLQLSAPTTDHLAHKSSVFQGITSPELFAMVVVYVA